MLGAGRGMFVQVLGAHCRGKERDQELPFSPSPPEAAVWEGSPENYGCSARGFLRGEVLRTGFWYLVGGVAGGRKCPFPRAASLGMKVPGFSPSWTGFGVNDAFV